MNSIGIILGAIVILSAVAVCAGVLLQSDTNGGLSAAIGGVGGGEMKDKTKNPLNATCDKSVMIGMMACFIATIALSVMAISG